MMTIDKWFSLVKDEKLRTALDKATESHRREHRAGSLSSAISSAFSWSETKVTPPEGYHYNLGDETPYSEISKGWRMVYMLAERNRIPMEKIPSASKLISQIGDPITRSTLREIYRNVTRLRPQLKRRYYDDVKDLIKTIQSYVPDDNYEYHAILDVLYKGNFSD